MHHRRHGRAAKRTDKRLIEAQLGNYLEGTVPDAPGTLSATGSAARSLLLPALAYLLKGSKDFHDVHARDALAETSLALLPDEAGAVALAGHTHGAKCIPVGAGKGCINTGTWQDLLEVPHRWMRLN